MKAAKKYEVHLEGSGLLQLEIRLWKTKWAGELIAPTTCTEALKNIDVLYYPKAAVLLQMFSTIPVTTATEERTFSTQDTLRHIFVAQ